MTKISSSKWNLLRIYKCDETNNNKKIDTTAFSTQNLLENIKELTTYIINQSIKHEHQCK